MTTVGRVTMAVVAGVLLLASAVSAQSAAGAATAGDLLPFVERLGFPAAAFYLMWRLVTGELRQNTAAQQGMAKALSEVATQLAALRERMGD